MSDSSQTLCKIPLHSINLTHLILMFLSDEQDKQGTSRTDRTSLFDVADVHWSLAAGSS